MTSDAIAAAFLQARCARGGAWYVQPLFGSRLYATRGPEGQFGLFVRGSLESFGRLPQSTFVEHEEEVVIEPEGERSPMLRILAPARYQGNRAVVYLAIEACRLLEENPSLGGEELLSRLLWLMVLLEDDSTVLSPERQRGLVGELQLLTRLVRRARFVGRSPLIALQSWHGPWPSKRDFAASGIAVEVKTASGAERTHSISFLQLEPQSESEEVFLYSLGVRHDHSAPRKLVHFVQDVETLLAAHELSEFHTRLRAYGFDPDRSDVYEYEPGLSPFHFEPRFFAEAHLPRLRFSSFVGGSPPDVVLDISYRLRVVGAPVELASETLLLDRLLT